MAKGRVLIVLTNCGELGKTGHKTGWYLPEVAHPYKVFTEAGYAVDFVSPKGGKAPMDPGSKEASKDDEESQAFLKNKVIKDIESTKSPKTIKHSDYSCIFYAGGHGPMFDLPAATEVAALCTQIYEAGGVVGAVCHGTVGLVNVQLTNGQKLVKGQKVTSFTNAEEEAVKLMSVMPFALETRLKENGAEFVGAENFTCNVVCSGRIVTGQNPASAAATAQKMLEVMKP